jgi:hypothetical protein
LYQTGRAPFWPRSRSRAPPARRAPAAHPVRSPALALSMASLHTLALARRHRYPPQSRRFGALFPDLHQTPVSLRWIELVMRVAILVSIRDMRFTSGRRRTPELNWYNAYLKTQNGFQLGGHLLSTRLLGESYRDHYILLISGLSHCITLRHYLASLWPSYRSSRNMMAPCCCADLFP